MNPSEDTSHVLESFRFKTVFPSYFEPGKFLHFFLAEPRLFKADVIRIPNDIIESLCSFASIYPSFPSFFGVSMTVDRLSEKNLPFYGSLSTSWHYSFVACAIINHAVIESCGHFLQNYFYFKNHLSKESQSVMGHPFSPILGWCYFETTQFWLEDYAPIVGKRNAFVDNPALFNKHVQKIQEFFLPYHLLFNEEENPYIFISDNYSTLDFIESLNKTRKDIPFLAVSSESETNSSRSF
ncbi:hypothetical protein IT6_00930 [Methylacidiphilum caldifontis]|uniref:hypothetical protein n=1 Tax=Methylacidiphilum caldifontis TaxID=2795386 RepID=UPI001A8F3B19|nr:hypothetical protein [Methylacidiphilum caldifontis]QSR88904.1 hypothetical protein IT6_00930 [Methylacidiphilum caldifontis]